MNNMAMYEEVGNRQESMILAHMPMVKRLLGEASLSYTVDKGLAGGAPGRL